MRLFFCFLLFLTGCASNARFERDRYSSAYQSGGDRFFISQFSSAVRNIAGEDDDKPRKNAIVQPQDEALANLVVSGIALVMNRDYYKSPYISGRTLCHFVHEPEFEVPCGGVTILLRDRLTGELHRIQTEGSEFTFGGEEGHSYSLSLSEGRYHLAQPISAPLIVGDSVVLHLSRSAKRAD
jgi:hypothetical protein